jgi:Tfp pilus assembly ATPase PilU
VRGVEYNLPQGRKAPFYSTYPSRINIFFIESIVLKGQFNGIIYAANQININFFNNGVVVMKRLVIITVGKTHSGKTTFARALEKELNNSFVMDQDNHAEFINTYH